MRTGKCIRREFGPNSESLAYKNDGTLLSKRVVSQKVFLGDSVGCCPKM